MAKIALNPIIQSAQGKMGNVVLRRSHSGEMTLIKLAYEKSAAEQHKRPFDLLVSDYFKGRNLLLPPQS